MSFKSIEEIKAALSPDLSEVEYHQSPEAWEDQIVYFLLPDRFSDGNEITSSNAEGPQVPEGGTRMYTDDDKEKAVEPPANPSHWREAGKNWVGGTLKGVRSKLGYLKRLGVTAIWIGPVFKQVEQLDTYHGYGVQNFLAVDHRYGSAQDLKDLVEAAHDEKIWVILDVILNHSGDVFQYVYSDPKYTGEVFEVKGFYDKKLHRAASLPFHEVDDSQFPDGAIWPKELQNSACFTCKGKIDDWNNAAEYRQGDFFSLKDLNIGNPEPDNFNATKALKVLCDAYKYWIAFADIDGYRIDTVKHMGDGPTRYFAGQIHEYAQYLGKNKFLLVGEIAGGVGGDAYDTVRRTGIDAALGIEWVQQTLWKVPKGQLNPQTYFDQFRNARFVNEGSHTWLRDKVVTMIDDHDQLWRSDSSATKGRFCSESNHEALVAAAVMMNLCTLGIPCIYYGTEQAFDGEGGGDSKDRYIREAMFGGGFGGFRSKGVHFFNQDHEVYKAIVEITKVRKKEMGLRKGRQYLREIAGDGEHFGFPSKMGDGPILSLVAWSRLFVGDEILCAINTDPGSSKTAWATVDREVHPPGSRMSSLLPDGRGTVTVEDRAGRSVVLLKDVDAGGFVLLK